MAERLFVATRKGLFTIERRASGWTIGAPEFIGEPVSAVLADPRDGTLYAALNLGHFGSKLWRRRAGEADWHECTAPLYPPQPDPLPATAPDGPPVAPWSLQLLWTLVPGGADQPGRLWAGTIPGGLFCSDDGGDSWALNRALWDRPERLGWFGGGYDYPGIHSVCVDPRDSRHVTLAVSCGGVWQSRDDGASWACTCTGMHADYMPPERRDDPNIQDPHRLVQCAGQPDALWVQHHNGIFRSVDGGASWQDVVAPVSSFGFAVVVHPREPDTAWFVPAVKDACRIPVDGRFVVQRTRDGGLHFEVLDAGLPPAPGYDLVYRHGLAVNEDGQQLAMGSTTGALWLSEDGGGHWQCLSAHLPPIHEVQFA